MGRLPVMSMSNGSVTAAYRWPDLEVVISQMPSDLVRANLKGFEGFIRNHVLKGNVPPWTEALIKRIHQQRLIVGIVAHPDFDAQGRTEAIVDLLCNECKAIMFCGGYISDWDRSVLLSPDGTQQ